VRVASHVSSHRKRFELPCISVLTSPTFNCRLTNRGLHATPGKKGLGRKPFFFSQEHAGQLALEVLQSTFGLGGKASEPGHVPQPQQQSTASKPKANGQSTSAKGAGKAAAAGTKRGERFSVEQTPLTKYKRARPQKYHDWQAYKVSAKGAVRSKTF
jgi:hypothetical protein